MRSSRSRISVLAGAFGLFALVIVVHLSFVMIGNHEAWAARSHKNRWAFRSVPALRGSIADHNGRVLAYDEPTMEVTMYYLRFRLYHPVGAAVHGATTWAGLQSGRELVNYSYAGVLGPDVAARDLLAMPVSVFRRGAFDKDKDKDKAAVLATAVTTLISGTTGLSRRKVYRALREAAEGPVPRRCGDVLADFPEADVLSAYDRFLDSLREFDRQLLAIPEMQATTRRPGLITRLDWLRRASIDRRELTWIDRQGVRQPGELYENMEWPVADYVPFELAVPLRVGADAHPGLRVRPGVRRVSTEPRGTTLHSLLGEVRDVGRAEPADWFDGYFARLPEDWLEDIVPEEAAVSPEDRARMQQSAADSLKRLARRFERRGIAGIESAFDAELSGRLGMRLVERDSQQREQLMWSSLRVRSGDDVVLTIDSDLQLLAELAARTARDEMAALHLDEADRDLCKAALAIIDAGTGDVLAFAGNPITDGAAPGNPWAIPGVRWSGNGSLGSVVKPFVLIEQLLAEVLGRPCTPLSAFEPCSTKSFAYKGVKLGCIAHWDEGQQPVAALAKSCNTFFYQAAVGLGDEGLERALQRFGLAPADATSEFEPCWQARVPGFSWSQPQFEPGTPLPRRAIGYDVAASPLAVARAYAALATGRLPKLGMVKGRPRPGVALVGIDAELETVRRGLTACVLTGTAKGVAALARFGVLGKTGTAEIGAKKSLENLQGSENNAWFAGFLPYSGAAGVQLCFCSVIYWVPDGQHGADAAGGMIGDLLERLNADPDLRSRYMTPGGGR